MLIVKKAYSDSDYHPQQYSLKILNQDIGGLATNRNLT